MKKTQEQKLIVIAKKQGILRSSALKKMGIPRITLTRLVRTGKLERVARGLYKEPSVILTEKEGMIQVALRAPNAVFCLLTALHYYELTTQLPRQIWITMPQGSHCPQIVYPPIKMVQAIEKIYGEGIQTVKVDQVTLKIYNPARTIVDCFKYRNKIGLDVAIEALKNALYTKKTTRDKIFYFAKKLRVKTIIQPYIEAME